MKIHFVHQWELQSQGKNEGISPSSRTAKHQKVNEAAFL